MEQAKLRVKASMARSIGLFTSSSTILLRPSEAKKRGGNTVDASFNLGAREELNAKIARMFYSGSLSFNFAKNSYYAMTFTYVANNPSRLYHSRIQLLEDHSFAN